MPLGPALRRFLSAASPRSRRGALAALAAVVLPALWLSELRPRLDAPFTVASAHGPVAVPGWLPGDCYLYRTAIVSLLADADLDVRNDADWTMLLPQNNVAVTNDGAWVPKHSLLLPVLALPFFAAAGDRGLLAFNLLQVLVLDALVLALALRVARPGVALATALLFALGTLLRPLAFNFSPDVLSTALVAGAVLALLGRRAGVAGALLGLSLAAKWSNAMFFVPLALAALATGGVRPLLRLALAAAPPALFLAALNWRWFGSPFVTPYDRVFSNPGELPVLYAFDAPFWRGLWAQLVDRRLGLVVSAPPVLLAVPGFVFLWRRARLEAALLAACVVVPIAFFAKYRFWTASTAGHRFLLTAIVLCAPAVAIELERFADALRARGRARDADPAGSRPSGPSPFARVITSQRMRRGSVWFGVVFAIVLATEATTIGQHVGELHQADFLAIWSGARAVRSGLLATLPDAEAIRPYQEAWVGAKLASLHPWLYPPTALLLVWPLAFLPYLAAFALWTVGTAIPYLAALRRAFPPSRVVVLAGLASPAAFMTAINGQSSFLTAALIGWGVLLLPSRPAWGGVLLGLLAFKPQMALCVPVALVAGRLWLALAAFAATAAGTSLLAAACFGVGSWLAFFRVESPFAWTLMTDGRIGYHKVQSAFAAVRLLGGSMRLALSVHAVVAAAVVATLAWIWSRRAVPHELKAAALLSGGLAASVYLLDYDMVTATIAMALVVAHGLRSGWGRGELWVVALTAVVPMFSRVIGDATHVNVGAASLLALYAVVLRRAWRAEAEAGAPAAASASAAVPG